MSATFEDLETGDVLEIKYRLWRATGAGEDVVERWISAQVIACEPGTCPLVRLADGQPTEIRPFMTWRRIARSERRKTVGLAA